MKWRLCSDFPPQAACVLPAAVEVVKGDLLQVVCGHKECYPRFIVRKSYDDATKDLEVFSCCIRVILFFSRHDVYREKFYRSRHLRKIACSIPFSDDATSCN